MDCSIDDDEGFVRSTNIWQDLLVDFYDRDNPLGKFTTKITEMLTHVSGGGIIIGGS